MDRRSLSKSCAVLLLLLPTLSGCGPSQEEELLDEARATKIEFDAKALLQTAQLYSLMNNRLPQPDELKEYTATGDGEPLAKSLRDPWGNEYIYKIVGEEPVVLCHGEDGKEGGTGKAEDRAWVRKASGEIVELESERIGD